MTEFLLPAITLGIFLAFLIGPVFFVLLETAAIKGARAAIALDIGVIVADIAFILIAYLTANQLLQKIKDDPILYLVGGIIFITYGIISLLKNKKQYHQHTDPTLTIVPQKNYLTLFVKGFFINFINIGVLGFWLGILIVFAPQLQMQPNKIFLFFSTILITYFIVDLFKILAAKKLNKYLTPYRIYTIKRIISIIIILSGAILLIRALYQSTTATHHTLIHFY